MQPACGRSDYLGKPRFDVEVNVLQAALEDEATFADLGSDLRQPAQNDVSILAGNDALGGQHRHVRARTLDVLLGQPFVEFDGDVYLLHDICGAAREPPAPHLIRSHGPAMPFLRPRTLIGLALLMFAVAGSVLYVIRTRPVHAPVAPPPALARLAWDASPRPVPAVGFARADGKRSTPASFAHHYVLLNLWATWCAPCVRELPQLSALQSALPGLEVVPVNVGRDNAAQTAAFMKAHGAAKLAVYVDSDAALIRAFNVPGLPVSVLVDPRGREIARALGPCDWAAPAAIDYLRRLIAAPARNS